MKLRVPKQSEEKPEVCDLTQNGSDAISHLAFHFVNEKKLQIPKKSRIALGEPVTRRRMGATPAIVRLILVREDGSSTSS